LFFYSTVGVTFYSDVEVEHYSHVLNSYVEPAVGALRIRQAIVEHLDRALMTIRSCGTGRLDLVAAVLGRLLDRAGS